MCAKSLQSCPAVCNPMDCSPPVHGFFQAFLPCSPSGDLPNPGIKTVSPALAGRFFTTSTTWEAPCPSLRVIIYPSSFLGFLCLIYEKGRLLQVCQSSAHSSVQFSSVAQSCPTLCRPHGLQHARLPCPSSTPQACSNSCLVGDAIQPSHPLSSPSPPAFIRGFPKESVLHMAKLLEFQLQHQSFQ